MATPSTSLLTDDVMEIYQYAARKHLFPKFVGGFNIGGHRVITRTGDVSSLGGGINVVYGAPVFDQVNRAANETAATKTENWVKSGFRVELSDPAKSLFGGADPGIVGGDYAAPGGTVVDVDLRELDSIPGFVHTPFDLTQDAAFRGRHDDGLDLWEHKLAIGRDHHQKGMNREFLATVATTGTLVPTADAKNDNTANGGTGTGVGIESKDRLIASAAEAALFSPVVHPSWYDVYEGQVSRAAPSQFDSVVVDGAGAALTTLTPTAFLLDSLEALIDGTHENNADEKSQYFSTGIDTRRKIYRELRSIGRADATERQAKITLQGINQAGTQAGRDVTFAVRVYEERMILADSDIGNDGIIGIGEIATGSHVYLTDQRHIHKKVGFPTIYADVDNPVVRGQFDTLALFLSCYQNYMTRFNTSGKVVLITA